MLLIDDNSLLLIDDNSLILDDGENGTGAGLFIEADSILVSGISGTASVPGMTISDGTLEIEIAEVDV